MLSESFRSDLQTFSQCNVLATRNNENVQTYQTDNLEYIGLVMGLNRSAGLTL